MSDETEARLALEARAKELGVKFAPNIGDERLQARVDAAEPKTGDAPTADDGEAPAATAPTAPEPAVAAPAAPAAPEVTTDSKGQARTEPAEDPGPVVTVIGPKKGRWRAGRHFTREAAKIPLSELAEAELEALKGDPRLTVTVPDLGD